MSRSAAAFTRPGYIVKSRGTAHSSDIHKLILSDDGIALVPVDATGSQKKLIGKSLRAPEDLGRIPSRPNDRRTDESWEPCTQTSLSVSAVQLVASVRTGRFGRHVP